MCRGGIVLPYKSAFSKVRLLRMRLILGFYLDFLAAPRSGVSATVLEYPPKGGLRADRGSWPGHAFFGFGSV